MTERKVSPPGTLDTRFIQRVLFVFVVLGFALLLTKMVTLLLLVFGAVVVAVLLRAIADPICERTRLKEPLAVLAAVVIVLAVLALAGWLFGRQIEAQAAVLSETLPQAWERLQAQIRTTPLGARLLDDLQQAGGQASRALALAPRVAAGVAGSLANLLVVIVAGVYLAVEPTRYRDGLVVLFPPDARPHLKHALDTTGRALTRWLLGTLFSMTVIGVLTGIGLAVVGVPSPLALGLLAGLAQFVPIVGPLVSAVPGLILAASAGPQALIWTAAVYFGVQQLESNFITPYVQKRLASVPMALTLFAVVGFGLLLGPMGVLFATPLTVVLFVLVKMLYLREVLDEPVQVPGERPLAEEKADEQA